MAYSVSSIVGKVSLKKIKDNPYTVTGNELTKWIKWLVYFVSLSLQSYITVI